MSSFFFFFFCAEFRPIRPLIDVLWQSRCRRRDAAKVWDVACVHVSAPPERRVSAIWWRSCAEGAGVGQKKDNT